jgi:hypothetical protein
MPLFDAQEFGKLVPHKVEGFKHAVPSICYPRRPR